MAVAAAPHATLSFLPLLVLLLVCPSVLSHRAEAPQVKAVTTMHRATLAACSLARSLLPPSGRLSAGHMGSPSGCVCMSENPAAAASATLAPHSSLRRSRRGPSSLTCMSRAGWSETRQEKLGSLPGRAGRLCPAPAVLLRADVMLLIASDSKNSTRTSDESGLTPLRLRALVRHISLLEIPLLCPISNGDDGNGIATP